MADLSFSHITGPSRISCSASPADKEAALAIAVDLVTRDGGIPWPRAEYAKRKTARKLFMKTLADTGWGEGVAVPHALCDYVKETRMGILYLKKALPFDAIDEIPVDLIFLITGPRSDYTGHLKLLSKLARLLNNADFRTELRAAPDEESLYQVLATHD